MTVDMPSDGLDPQRQAAQQQLERAVGEGRLTLDEFTDRAGRVWSADSEAALTRTVADLPARIVGQSTPARSTIIGLIGDISRRGRWSLRRRTTAVLLIGDVELDLRTATLAPGDEQDVQDVQVTTWSVIGDVALTVPEGVEVEIGGFTIIGDRKLDLAPVPRVQGTPVIRIRVFSLIGDVKVRSAP
ncbi:MAG: DUF1707 domain-containing protein [Pseudonocardia sp.]|nr:DUF1707 domain-containing protein [Pseudonocardia sp.]